MHSIFACPKLRLQVILFVNYRCPVNTTHCFLPRRKADENTSKPISKLIISFCFETMKEGATLGRKLKDEHHEYCSVNLIVLVKRGSVRFTSQKAYTRVEGALIIDQKAGNEESQNYGYVIRMASYIIGCGLFFQKIRSQFRKGTEQFKSNPITREV